MRTQILLKMPPPQKKCWKLTEIIFELLNEIAAVAWS